MKVVINTCYGGFGITDEVKELYKKTTGKVLSYVVDTEFRCDPKLIEIIETIGLENSADGPGTKLAIIEVPDDTQVEILDFDGYEEIVDARYHWCAVEREY